MGDAIFLALFVALMIAFGIWEWRMGRHQIGDLEETMRLYRQAEEMGQIRTEYMKEMGRHALARGKRENG